MNQVAIDRFHYCPPVYKLFERLILNRIQPILENVLPIEQAGFRKNRACCDQVLALTTYIENGYKEKSGAVFLNLYSAYDTVWKRGLMLKLSKIIRCKSTLRLIESLLSNRKYNIFLNGVASRHKYLQNSLPRDLCYHRFSLTVYTSYIVDTISRKFIYADDIALVAQAKDFTKVEDILNQDLINLQHYFTKWHLTFNPNKTVAIALHLINQEAQRELKLKIEITISSTKNVQNI